MHTETKRTAIPPDVKASVALRDSLYGPATCIICGAPGMPCCHVVRRSQGGRGDTERNIVTLCHGCHRAFGEGIGIRRLRTFGFEAQKDVEAFIVEYIKGFYPDWTPESVTYHKWKKEAANGLEAT